MSHYRPFLSLHRTFNALLTLTAAVISVAAYAQEGEIVRGLDGQSWMLASKQTMSGVTMSEYVRQGETLESAREHYTVMKMPGTTDAAAMAKKVLAMTEDTCAAFTSQVYWADTADTLYEWKASGCDDPKHRAEHEIARLLRMDDGVYRLSYAYRAAEMPPANRTQWLKLIGEAWRKGPKPLDETIAKVETLSDKARSELAAAPAAATVTTQTATTVTPAAPTMEPSAEAARQQRLREADARAKELVDELTKEFEAIYPEDHADPAKVAALAKPPGPVADAPLPPASKHAITLHHVKEDGSAGPETQIYTPTETHYAVVRVTPADAGKTLRGTWQGPAAFKVNPFYERSVSLDGKGEYAVFSVRNNKPFPPGDYTFEVTLDGAPVGRAQYRVTP